MLRVFESPFTVERINVARKFITSIPSPQQVLLVGPSRESVDHIARETSLAVTATFGMYRYSFTQLAAHCAMMLLVGAGRAPATPLGEQALAVRASYQAASEGKLGYFAPVVQHPGFARSLAATIADLRGARLAAQQLRGLGPAAEDLKTLVDSFEHQLQEW